MTEFDEFYDRFHEKAEIAVEKLGDYVNNFFYDSQAETFVECLNNQHPTLQANVIRLFINVLKLYKDVDRVDGRNVDAVEACKKLEPILSEIGIRTV